MEMSIRLGDGLEFHSLTAWLIVWFSQMDREVKAFFCLISDKCCCGFRSLLKSRLLAAGGKKLPLIRWWWAKRVSAHLLSVTDHATHG